MKLHKTWLVALLATTLSGDTMLTVALIWTAMSSSSSTLPLGLTLALMSIVPYALQSVLPALKSWITRGPLHVFAVARMAGLVVALAGILMPAPMPLWALYCAAGLFTVTVFIAQQCVETAMAGLVLRQVLSAKEASRLSQTSIQLGAFVGGAIGGMLLERAGIRWTFVALFGTLSVGTLVPVLLRDAASHLQRSHPQPRGAAARDASPGGGRALGSSRSLVLWLALIGVLVLTVQLGAFNYLIPLILQKGKEWHASDYGLVSAAAGVGALLATLVVVGRGRERLLVLVSIAMIGLADYGLHITGSVVIALVLAFALGYAFNTLRIRQREIIFEHVETDRESAEWAARTTVVFQVIKAMMPLILSFILDGVGVGHAGAILTGVGISVAAALLVLTMQQRRRVAVLALAK